MAASAIAEAARKQVIAGQVTNPYPKPAEARREQILEGGFPMRGVRQFCGLTGALVMVVVVCGCGSTSGPPSTEGNSPLLGLLDVTPYPSAGQYYRYRDVLDHRFLVPTYNPEDGSDNGWYAGDLGEVAVAYDLDSGTTLVGTVTADGLKPNFAY